MIQGAVKAANKQEKQLSSAAAAAAASEKKAVPVASKPPADLMQYEEQSSQFMSFLSSEQAKCEYTSLEHALLVLLIMHFYIMQVHVCASLLFLYSQTIISTGRDYAKLQSGCMRADATKWWSGCV